MDSVDAVFDRAVQNGAHVVSEPQIMRDTDGEVKVLSIITYCYNFHTLVERSRYHGAFLPGYRSVQQKDPLSSILPEIKLEAVDHCVGNQDWDEMEATCE